MQVSKDIYWGILKNRSSHLIKTRYGSFSSDPFNASNRHTAVQNGMRDFLIYK